MSDNNLEQLWTIIQALNTEAKSPAEEFIQDALEVILDEMRRNQRWQAENQKNWQGI